VPPNGSCLDIHPDQLSDLHLGNWHVRPLLRCQPDSKNFPPAWLVSERDWRLANLFTLLGFELDEELDVDGLVIFWLPGLNLHGSHLLLFSILFF
jgi:hypothetical protein